MGMRSDSPRVAAVQSERRPAPSGGGAGARGTDIEKFGIYDSPTLLPRSSLASDTLLSTGDSFSKEDDERSFGDNLSSTSDTGEGKEKTFINRAMDSVTKAMAEQEEDMEEDTFEMEGNIIDDTITQFSLCSPSLMPSYLNVHFICETASRLLFLSVHWVRSIPAFSLLTYETQIGLVRNSWSDLFVLGMAQCSEKMNLPAILVGIVSHLQASVATDKLTGARVKQVSNTICKLQEYVRAIKRLNLDDHEFAYLKTIALFGADQAGLSCPRQVERFCDKAVSELRDYCYSCLPDDKNRFSKLLLRLSPLRSLQPDVLEELFFAGLIGNVQIDSVIPYILKMESSEYQAQCTSDMHSEERSESPIAAEEDSS